MLSLMPVLRVKEVVDRRCRLSDNVRLIKKAPRVNRLLAVLIATGLALTAYFGLAAWRAGYYAADTTAAIPHRP